MIRKFLWFMAVACFMAMTSRAQQVTINGIEVVGLTPDYNDLGFSEGMVLLTKVNLTYSKIKADDAGCIVLVNDGRIPTISTGHELLGAASDLNYGTEDLQATDAPVTKELSVKIPIDNDRFKGGDNMLTVQAFALCDEYNPKLLAKGTPLKIDPTKLKVIQPANTINFNSGDMQHELAKGLFKSALSNPVIIDDHGYKLCTACHGEGKTSKTDYFDRPSSGKQEITTISTCKVCGGAGKLKATKEDYELNKKASEMMDKDGFGDKLVNDLFGGSGNKKTEGQKTQKSSGGKQSSTNKSAESGSLDGILNSLLGF